jgi:bifunctional pyridoxal-dependent enzyme with beta-cystathionase and maltose regulon repressor activities
VIGIALKFKVFSISDEIHAALAQQRMMFLTVVLTLMRIRQLVEVKHRFTFFIIAFS